ncbi:MAG: LuxR C-terminal-related transcriptional regulator, partial [Pontixanthobacter sp.]
MNDGLDALTAKEKEALRLMVRGHDAKSMASQLDLSVHTINDRLRAARRKMQVTSSREAARLLFEDETEGPQNHVHHGLGGAGAADGGNIPDPSNPRQSVAGPAAVTGSRMIKGTIAMSLLLALAVSATLSTNDHPASNSVIEPADSSAQQIATDHATEAAARDWLRLTDSGDWAASYENTGD